MKDFVITQDELAALSGLPHVQQLAYLRGIRPYMNVNTGLVGVDRVISYNTIATQLYIQPHAGFKATQFSYAQIRRAVAGIERAGLITFESSDSALILSCPKASKYSFAQQKGITNPSPQAVSPSYAELDEITGELVPTHDKAVREDDNEAGTHTINNAQRQRPAAKKSAAPREFALC